MVRVKLFANFREAAGVKEVEVDASTVLEVLVALSSMFPKLKDMFFENGEVRDYVNIMVNGKHVRDELERKLEPGDVVAIFPPVSGG